MVLQCEQNANKTYTTIMPRLILHVGMPRTGTTSLQELLTNGGLVGNVLYPDVYKDAEGYGHHEILKEMRKSPSEVAANLAHLSGIHQNCDLLLSTETLFQVIGDKDAEYFGHFLLSMQARGFRLNLICCVRNVVDFVWSIYIQNIRSGEVIKDFTAYFEASIRLISRSFFVLNELSKVIKVDIVRYSVSANEQILSLIYGEGGNRLNAGNVSLKRSLAPSLLLHAYFLWRNKNALEDLSTDLRWRLIARDLEGNFFSNAESRFEVIAPKTLARMVDEGRGERLESRAGCDIPDVFNDAMSHAGGPVYDLSEFRGGQIDLSKCFQALMSPPIAERFEENLIEDIRNSLLDFQNSLDCH